jgi:2-iminobutanoate/2-iminopropanoate deaminase
MSTRREFVSGTLLMATAKTRGPALKPITSSAAPKAIGPYSQAIIAGNLLFLSGQIALDPASGNLIEGDFSAQARRVFENLKSVLKEAGSDFGSVAKATVYLSDLANFSTLNTIYAEYFGDHKPARSTVGVAALPRGAAVEIDLIAVI